MNDFLNDLPLLVEVARQKSFTRAAEVLDIGASTLSRRIKLLEKKMGVLLFYRDTRNVELTPHGAFMLERCEFVLDEAKRTYDSLVLDMREPSGLLRICMYVDTYSQQGHLKKALTDFAAQWPNIEIKLTFVEHSVDMRTDPYDVAFLIESSIAPPLIARKLLTVEPFLYASPEFLSRWPMPREPQDLSLIPCIVLERHGAPWSLTNGKHQVVVEIQPRYSFSSSDLCKAFALGGHGVAMLRKQLGAPDEQAGRLVRLLPDWAGLKHDLKLVTAPGQLPARVRLFVDHVQASYASHQDSV